MAELVEDQDDDGVVGFKKWLESEGIPGDICEILQGKLYSEKILRSKKPS